MFDIFFAQFFNLPYFPVFFLPSIVMLTNLIFLVLENFTKSDRTPPYADTYLQLFPNFGNYGKKMLSDKNQSSIFSCFFPKYWNVIELDMFGSGEFHE